MPTHLFDVSDIRNWIFGDGVDRVGHWRILAMAMNILIASNSDTYTTCFETRTQSVYIHTIRAPQPRSDLDAMCMVSVCIMLEFNTGARGQSATFTSKFGSISIWNNPAGLD